MSTAVAPPPKRMTVEEFLALPDDGHRRWLIDGVVYPARDEPQLRTKRQGIASANTCYLLDGWVSKQAKPRGQVHAGYVGFRPDPTAATMLGTDVTYAPPELVLADTKVNPYFDGPPRVAVEIVSPSSVHSELVKKINAYLAAGATVWILDPDFRTIDIHRPGPPRLGLNETDELIGDPELPGFRAPVAQFFEG